ncbi:MAG: DoxX family rane protein [Devosia sp.]|uniref:DoxX family membrane protein n=1 Tax=Devosia sp. TaxID=1871048 RepID=UPI00261E19BA|nr:DoxX family membrane protein [Devosia sp.]MDB5587665.1 DoxX family rane protein [Devosia sp.]
MTLATTFILIGRIVFGLFFLIAGMRNFAGFKTRIPSKTNYGWDLPPPIVALGFAMQLVGGVFLAFGVLPVYSAALLIVFLVLATSLYHNLFLFHGKERDPHLYLVLVNITLAAGLLMIIGLSL